MKKFLSYFIVFIVGFLLCAWVIYKYYGAPNVFQGASSVSMPRGDIKIAGKGGSEVRQAAKKVSEYVVNIDTVGKPVMARGPGDFFGIPIGPPEEVVPQGKGSGVVFTSDGYILTNNHVVQDAAKLTVTLHNGKQYPAKLIGRDPKTDLAVVKIDAKGLSYARFADSDTLEVGDWVIAVGNALGLGPTVTVGVVSATKRGPIIIENKVLEQVIQTDASINRGNSGGALADINGNLVGINTAIASSGPNGGSIGIGFAVPANIAKTISEELVRTGKVKRPWLGITYSGLTDELRASMQQRGFKLPKGDGAVIFEVLSGSPAAEAGLKSLDVILKIDGKPVTSGQKSEGGRVTVADAIGGLKVGGRVTLEVWHSQTGRTGDVGVVVGEMPADLGERQ